MNQSGIAGEIANRRGKQPKVIYLSCRPRNGGSKVRLVKCGRSFIASNPNEASQHRTIYQKILGPIPGADVNFVPAPTVSVRPFQCIELSVPPHQTPDEARIPDIRFP